MKSKFLLQGLVAASVLASSSAFADVRLPRIFGDHMVLQRDKGVPVWGWADPGEKVTVTAGKTTASATAGADGKWKVQLGNLPASATPIEVTVAGKNTVTFQDVLVGDVWVCSGQSNMEWNINNESSAKEEIAKADKPQLRLFLVPKLSAPKPMEEIETPAGLQGAWQICTPETLSKLNFTAVGYYFGKNILENIKQPIGLIGTYWGGTTAQAWTTQEGLESTPALAHYVAGAKKYADNYQQLMDAHGPAMEKFKVDLAKWKEDNKEAIMADAAALQAWDAEAKQAVAEGRTVPPRPTPSVKEPKAPVPPNRAPGNPTALNNGMVAPIVPYAIKGAIWYQGESNAGQAVEYRTLFPTMITSWRKQWGQGDFPFLFVQLANHMARNPEPADSNWAMLREAQLKTLSLPNTGMAVIIDLGEANDIHPRDKWDVGMRLSLAGRHVAYGEKLVYSGPIYKAMKVEGSKVRVEFDHVGGGLVLGDTPEHFHPGAPKSPASELQGFAIAGEDGKFVWAQAKIDGNTVVVSSDAVATPVAVRYAWAHNPAANLYNKEGLPASPFRTDSDAK